jgi:hypothetical protein
MGHPKIEAECAFCGNLGHPSRKLVAITARFAALILEKMTVYPQGPVKIAGDKHVIGSSPINGTNGR